MIRFFLLAIVWFSLVKEAQGQFRQIVTQHTEWFMLTSNIKLTQRIGFTFDAQFRFSQNFVGMQHFVRNGLDVSVNKKFSFVPVGYMYLGITVMENCLQGL